MSHHTCTDGASNSTVPSRDATPSLSEPNARARLLDLPALTLDVARQDDGIHLKKAAQALGILAHGQKALESLPIDQAPVVKPAVCALLDPARRRSPPTPV